MRIEDFKSNYVIGARPNLFKIEITGENLPKLEFLAKAAAIPGKTIGDIDVPYMGKKIKIAGDVTFEDWQLTVLMDEDYGVRKGLEQWMERIARNSSALAANAHKQYKRDAYIIHLGNNGNVINKYQMIGCYPSQLSSIDMNWDQTDQVIEYTVTMRFDWWKNDYIPAA